MEDALRKSDDPVQRVGLVAMLVELKDRPKLLTPRGGQILFGLDAGPPCSLHLGQ